MDWNPLIENVLQDARFWSYFALSWIIKLLKKLWAKRPPLLGGKGKVKSEKTDPQSMESLMNLLNKWREEGYPENRKNEIKLFLETLRENGKVWVMRGYRLDWQYAPSFDELLLVMDWDEMGRLINDFVHPPRLNENKQARTIKLNGWSSRLDAQIVNNTIIPKINKLIDKMLTPEMVVLFPKEMKQAMDQWKKEALSLELSNDSRLEAVFLYVYMQLQFLDHLLKKLPKTETTSLVLESVSNILSAASFSIKTSCEKETNLFNQIDDLFNTDLYIEKSLSRLWRSLLSQVKLNAPVAMEVSSTTRASTIRFSVDSEYSETNSPTEVAFLANISIKDSQVNKNNSQVDKNKSSWVIFSDKKTLSDLMNQYNPLSFIKRRYFSSATKGTI